MDSMVITLLVLAAAVLLFLTEWVSYTATALMVPVVLYLTGVLSATEIVAGLTNSGCLLCAAMLIIGGSILNSGLARTVGTVIIRVCQNERTTMTVLMGVCILMSSFLSNMGTATLMVPLAIGVCQAKKEFRISKLLMAVALGCSMGGMNTLVGTAANMVVRSALEAYAFGVIGFFTFAKVGLPISVLGMAYMYLIGYRLCPCTGAKAEDLVSCEQNHSLNNRRSRIVIGIVFLFVIGGMCLEGVTGIPVHIVAFTGVLILFFTRTITDKQAYGFIQWPAVFLVAGMLPLATAMQNTGAADFIAKWITSPFTKANLVIPALTVLFLVAFLLTQFMSNTAAVSILVPIAISVSAHMGIQPMPVVMTVAAAAQCAFATPLATPHNAYIMEVAQYRFKDFLRVGLPLSLLSLAVVLLLVPMIWPL